MSNIEQTLSIIKPDAVERNLEQEIKNIFLSNGFKIIKEKKIHLENTDAEKFYKVHETKPFFSNSFLISSCKFLSTASGLMIDKVCSTLLIIILNKFV